MKSRSRFIRENGLPQAQYYIESDEEASGYNRSVRESAALY